MENLINFISNGYSYDHGYGDGFGNGYGYGHGNGYRCSVCDGNSGGYGYGHGNGYRCSVCGGDSGGYGYGGGNSGRYSYGGGDSGYGGGFGGGYGDCDGYGGNGGNDIKKINGMDVVKIDNIPTAIKRIRGNIAFGYVFEKMQLKPCYVVKQDNMFAHGETVKEAFSALKDKLFNNMPIDERINAFLKEIKSNTEYPAKIFYDWHHRLTGSCEFGRNQFIKNHNIKLDQLMTVDEFIELTKNNYGGEIIKELEKRLEETK